MNAIGIALVWCVAQVTLLGLIVGGLHRQARWLRPAAAASVAISGLVLVIVLSLLAFSPWPRWDLVHSLGVLRAASSPTGWGASTEPAELSDRGQIGRPPSPDWQEAMPAPDERMRPVDEPPSGLSPDLATGSASARRRLRSGGRPIGDRDVRELLDVLWAELGGVRPIAVRECGSEARRFWRGRRGRTADASGRQSRTPP